MSGCGCTNSKTGEPKRSYAAQFQAERACEESRNTYSDGDTLTVYYCSEGKCWHVGNSWDLDPPEIQTEQASRAGWSLADPRLED